MDKREAILRELNLYPQWVLRNQPAPKAGNPLSAAADVELTPLVAELEVVSVVETVEMPEVPQTVATSLSGGEADTDADNDPDTRQSAMGIVALNPSYVSSLDWPQLKQQVRDCTLCRLRATCTQTVFGVGDEKADWLFVGEGPGADEDVQGEPFVGEAGKLLDSMLAAIKLKRGKNVYIANIVKCRPPNNRTPAEDEIAQCLPYLQRQIELLQPKLIVALGKVASNALLRMGDAEGIAHLSASPLQGLGQEATLASLRGTLHDYHGIPLIVTYHPAYLLRSPTEKAKAWQDLCFAVKVMAQVTDKNA
jgi:uracil-DNA glycosylase family 4